MSTPAHHAFVLAGGKGTRFWPLSRSAHPKQLLDFTGDGSLLGTTLDRIEPLIPASRQWILTSAELAAAVSAAVPAVDPSRIVAEPVGRNTAPAIALAAAVLEAAGQASAAMVVLPSDHLITPGDDFRATLSRALDIASSTDLLLTFGVTPNRPETGYGYIETAEVIEGLAPARHVAAFTEKPDRPTAESYVAGDRHLWNSGMFAWRAEVLLSTLAQFEPEMVESMRRVAAAGSPGTAAFGSALEEAYEVSPAISIDFALMEKADNVGVLPADFQWNDVGHWLAMRDLWPQDADGNAARGDVLSVQSARNIVYGPNRLTALVGVENLVVVHTEDATLVCSADQAQQVRKVLDALEEQNKPEYL